MAKPLRNEISRQAMKTFLHNKKVIHHHLFDKIHWESMKMTLEGVSHSFHLWVTKHISGFCSVHRRRNPVIEVTSPMCPICKLEDSIETTRHPLICNDETRSLLWKDSNKELEEWLLKYDTMPDLIDLITGYVLGRGGKSITSLLLHNFLANTAKK